VTVSWKHGATMDRARDRRRAARGIEASVILIEEEPTIDGYDAIVAGSAVYAGHCSRRRSDSWKATPPR
jgi:hypothetical protein